MTRMRGIDVSDNQGYIDWKKAKAAGVDFGILRTTRRSANPDKYLPTNIKGCADNGIPADYYKYSYAVTMAEAVKEAQRVCDVLKVYGVTSSTDNVIWMDVEDKIQFALSKKALTDIVKAWKDCILQNGYSFGLYMGKYAYEHNKLAVETFDDHIWIARYYKGNTIVPVSEWPNEQYKPAAKAGSLWGWQDTSKGVVSGIKGNVDLDVAYYDIKHSVIETEYYATPEFTLIDSLNKIGVDSSYNNRKRIAIANGIQNYSGTAAQNIEMLSMLNDGILKKA